MLWLFIGPIRVYLLDFFYSSIQFYVLLSPYLCLISFLYLDLYVLGDHTWRCKGHFMQTKHVCVLIHIWTSELRMRLEPWNRFKPSSKIFYWPLQGGTSFVLLMSCVCRGFASARIWPCGHLLGKGWPLGSRLWCLCFCHFPMWHPGSGAVLDCIDSWSLPPFILS